MLKTLFLLVIMSQAFITYASEPRTLRNEVLTENDVEQVNNILRKLYESFSYEAEEEPNWDLMQSVFVKGAQIILEPPEGKSIQSQTIEQFIKSWQTTIRNSEKPTVTTSEIIMDKLITKVGNLIRVDILFRAIKSTDKVQREPGLDTLMLIDDDRDLKIISFIVQFESKLPVEE